MPMKKKCIFYLKISCLFFTDRMSQNPWQVDSIEVFYYLKCPECQFDTQEEVTFQDHAVANHPLSFTLFGKSEITQISVDPENLIGLQGIFLFWQRNHR